MKKFRFSDWMSMARGANLPTVWTNVLAAWAINAGAGPSLRWMPEWTDMGFFERNHPCLVGYRCQVPASSMPVAVF